jgi:hypothetical protein
MADFVASFASLGEKQGHNRKDRKGLAKDGKKSSLLRLRFGRSRELYRIIAVFRISRT